MAMGSAPCSWVVLAVELLASAVYAQSYEGGTIFTGLETGDHPSLVPQVLRYPRWTKTPISRHADRGAHASGARPIRDVGAAGGVLREGLPLDEVAGRLAGARTDERARSSRSPTRWATTPCSSPATGDTSAPPTNSRSSTTRRSSTCPPSRMSVSWVCGTSSCRRDWNPRRGPDGRAKPAATRSGSSTTHSRWRPRAEEGERADESGRRWNSHRAGLRPVDDRDRGTVDRRDPPGDRAPSAGSSDAHSPTEIRIRLDPPGGRRAHGQERVRGRLARGRGRTSVAGRSPVDGFLQGVRAPFEHARGRPHLPRRRGDARPRRSAPRSGLSAGRSTPGARCANAALSSRSPAGQPRYAVSPTAARRRSSPSMNRSMSPPRTREGSPTSTSVRWSFTIWYGAST